jgi:hypothetical protein
MKKAPFKSVLLLVAVGLAVNLAGCTALQKKFTRKRKPKPKEEIFSAVRGDDVKPSGELYEKHYIFWVNWHKKFIAELGESYKSDLRSTEEMISNLEDMASLLSDEKSGELRPHIDGLEKIKVIIEKRNMTKVNEIRIRRIAEREYRNIRRGFLPRKMADYIREDWGSVD